MTPSVDKLKHVVGIVPIAGLPLEYNFPWHDCLMPVGADYHAVERAIHTCALAGVSTIWLVMHRESQPLLRRKIGEWIYDPEFVWVFNSFFKKREIPIYYIPIKPRDRGRRDSHAWSSLYGGKIANYVSSKISKWVKPTKFLVVSPYGVISDETAISLRESLKEKGNLYIANGDSNFQTDGHMPFTYTQDIWKKCFDWCRENYIYDDAGRKWGEVFSSVDLTTYTRVDAKWAYDISNWEGYRKFMASEHAKECVRPKYMVSHRWNGHVALRTKEYLDLKAERQAKEAREK